MSNCIQDHIQLSVIVPIYNAEKYLAKCLDSIQKQKLQGNMEVLCVNDGSTDDSLKIAISYAKTDSRFRVLSQTNQGRSSARNHGLRKAKGDFITFVDADDLVGTSKLVNGNEFQSMLEQMKDGIDLVIGGIEVVHEANSQKKLMDKTYYAPTFVGKFDIDAETLLKINCSSCGKIFRRRIIEKYNLSYPVGLNYEDAFWWFCYAVCIKRAYYIQDTVYTYFRHDSGIMNETFNIKNTELAMHHILIIERFYQFLKRNQQTKLYRKLVLTLFEIYLNTALQYCREEDRLYVLWKAGKILRKNDIDVSGSEYFSALKKGKIDQFSFSPSILKDARRWQKLKRVFDRFCPKNSFRRRLFLSFCGCLSVLMKKKINKGL